MLTRGRSLVALAVLVSGSGCELAEPGPDVQTGLIALEIDQPVLDADGVSWTTLTAVLRDDTRAEVTVSFATSAGMFVAATNVAGSTSATTKAQGNRASVRLRASARAETAFVRATASSYAADSVVVFRRFPPDSVSLKPSRLTAPPDGTTTVTLEAVLRTNREGASVTEATPVRFTVWNADSGTQRPDQSGAEVSNATGKATFALRSTEEGRFGIAASVPSAPGVADTVFVRFEKPAELKYTNLLREGPDEDLRHRVPRRRPAFQRASVRLARIGERHPRPGGRGCNEGGEPCGTARSDAGHRREPEKRHRGRGGPGLDRVPGTRQHRAAHEELPWGGQVPGYSRGRGWPRVAELRPPAALLVCGRRPLHRQMPMSRPFGLVYA